MSNLTSHHSVGDYFSITAQHGKYFSHRERIKKFESPEYISGKRFNYVFHNLGFFSKNNSDWKWKNHWKVIVLHKSVFFTLQLFSNKLVSFVTSSSHSGGNKKQKHKAVKVLKKCVSGLKETEIRNTFNNTVKNPTSLAGAWASTPISITWACVTPPTYL